MARARKPRSTKPSPTRRAAAKNTDENEPLKRTLWSGSISFGLLQIPVSLHSAERRGSEVRLRLLDRRDLAPVRNQRVNSESGKKLEWNDIVKGFEYEPGQFVVIDDEDLKKANVEATQTIDIQDFVPMDDIDPAFFETPYYAVPTKRSAKAYRLLYEALRKSSAAAISTFVMKTREHLCALLPHEDAILVEILRFNHELVSADDLPVSIAAMKGMKFSEREMQMAERLIEEMTTEWRPEKYKDAYYADVMRMIEQKVKTGRSKPSSKPRAAGTRSDKVIDLVAILKESVAAKGQRSNREDRKGAAA